MMLIMQILVVLGIGLVIYAVFGVFGSAKPEAPRKRKIHNPVFPEEDAAGKEQKIQRLQSQIGKLESQLEESRVASEEGKSGLVDVQEKEAEFSVELKRREEWVAKAEAELAKIKAENLDLNKKFTTKEKELQEEFTKNVNLTREIREIKSALEAKEMACRLKDDQVQAQKQQIEIQLKSINESSAAIAEFNRKEKISEWVPKLEFNKLNEEYTKLEKDLESTQERLKSFAAEIAHLRQNVAKKELPAEEAGSVKTSSAELKPEGAVPEATNQEEAKPQEAKEIVEVKAVVENTEKKIQETGEQK
jgi:chromosome segregation protein